jgi:hypothetical protein
MINAQQENLINVSVVIRSADERTEHLCYKLIDEQGVSEGNIYSVKQRPFSKALRVGLEIGYETQTDWVYCIDADILLRPNAISEILEFGQFQDHSVCEIQGRVYDKFFGGPRPAGNHLYRRELIPEVIKRIPEEGINIRPEYHTLQAMKRDGYSWLDVDTCVGLHDSEQFFKDVYRKCFVQAHKHAHLAELFLETWRRQTSDDPDMRVALAGFSDGIKHAGEVHIDTRKTYYEVALDRLELKEKDPIELSCWNGERIAKIIDQWQVSELFLRYFPSSLQEEIIPRPSKLERLRQRISNRGPLVGSAYLGGAILNKVGRKIMRACK